MADRNGFKLEIRTVANGYIVLPPYDIRQSSDSSSPESMRVYESFDALVNHLRSYLPIFPAFDPAAPTPRKR